MQDGRKHQGAMDAGGLPRVRILATGGTIAGVQEHAGQAGYRAGMLSAGDLVAAVPQLSALARLDTEQVANIGSQDMDYAVWLLLARRIDVLLRDEQADGVVVTHGTDTLEETAYFLSLVIPHAQPLVLVGAMRPASAPGADGPANLCNAVRLAADPQAAGRGPLVVMNDEFHYAREVQKTRSIQCDAFASPNRGRAGWVSAAGTCFFSHNSRRHGAQSEFEVQDLPAQLPRVEIVYAHAGMGREQIDFLRRQSVAGIVLAGVGAGNATGAAMQALAEAAAAGVAVVRASRTGSGMTARNLEVDDDGLGLVAAGELNPQKARILLMLALTRTVDPVQVQRCFDEY